MNRHVSLGQLIVLPHEKIANHSLTGLPADILREKPLANKYLQVDSAIFNLQSFLNPLVSAASPLFTLAGDLHALSSTPDIAAIYDELIREIEIFESKAQAQNYRAQEIIAARYLICTLLDENMRNSHWGLRYNWADLPTLIEKYYNETDGGPRSFYILQRAAMEPDVNRDLIELGYMCLSVGLQGQFRTEPQGHDKLALIMDELYQLIREQHGNTTKKLLVDSDEKEEKKINWPLPPIWLVILIVLGIGALIYFPYHAHLQQLANPINQQITELSEGSS